MKKILFLFAFVILTFSLFSQTEDKSAGKSSDDQQINTLFGKGHCKIKIPVGYFIELNAAYTRFGSDDVFLPGMSAGIILNHHWTIGMTGQMVVNSGYLSYPGYYYNVTDQMWESAYLHGGYGGGLLEYTLMPNSIVHVSFPLMIGGGYMGYYDSNSNNWNTNNGKPMHHSAITENYFFVVEPGVRAEFNIIKHLRLGVGVSYRYVPNFNLEKQPTSYLNQFTGKLSLRFGKF
ncbi:MAG: hypothetical protein WCL00_07665 [Bacteroidota bacterium]